MLWLTVLETSVPGGLALLPSGPLGKQRIMGAVHGGGSGTSWWWEAKERQEETKIPIFPSGAHPPVPQLLPSQPHLPRASQAGDQAFGIGALEDTGALNHNSVLSETHQNKLMAPFHEDEQLA